MPEDEDVPPRTGVDSRAGATSASYQHRLLNQREEFDLGERISRGVVAQQLMDGLPEADASVRSALHLHMADGKRAADELALHNMRLVQKIANGYRWASGAALEFEDLVNEGYLGLARAVRGFDHTRNLKFSTYATWWIRQSIDRSIADKARSIRIPIHVRDELRRLLKAETALIETKGRATYRELAELTQTSEERIQMLLTWKEGVTSLDRVVGPDGGATLGDLVASRDLNAPETQAEQAELSELFQDMLSSLTGRERLVITERFGLEDGRIRTLEEIAKQLVVTRERIRQIETKALAKLRHPGSTRRLSGYFNSPPPPIES